MTTDELKSLVRTVPDFPVPGVRFRDITTLVADPAGLQSVIDHLTERASALKPEAIAGIEARGFLFGAAIAARLGIGFVTVRKPGKLPVPVIARHYALEYGADRLEIDPSLVREGQRIVLIDDLLATGGTASTAAALLREAGGVVTQAAFVIDLPDLGGAQRLRREGIEVAAIMRFEGE